MTYEEPISESRMLPNQGTPYGGKPSVTFYIKQDHVTSKIWFFCGRERSAKARRKGRREGNIT